MSISDFATSRGQGCRTGADTLASVVQAPLVQAGATVIRSDEVANVGDPRNFMPDGHFTPRIDRMIAQRLLAAVDNPVQ